MKIEKKRQKRPTRKQTNRQTNKTKPARPYVSHRRSFDYKDTIAWKLWIWENIVSAIGKDRRTNPLVPMADREILCLQETKYYQKVFCLDWASKLQKIGRIANRYTTNLVVSKCWKHITRTEESWEPQSNILRTMISTFSTGQIMQRDRWEGITDVIMGSLDHLSIGETCIRLCLGEP